MKKEDKEKKKQNINEKKNNKENNGQNCHNKHGREKTQNKNTIITNNGYRNSDNKGMFNEKQQ